MFKDRISLNSLSHFFPFGCILRVRDVLAVYLFPQSTKYDFVTAAISLQDDFLKQFNLTRESNTCPFAPGDVQPNSPMCVFPTDYTAAGPFVTAQTALFIPVADYQSTVSWIAPRRGSLDVFVHPNSGCSLNDHLHDAFWSGTRWELDPSIFFDENFPWG